MTEENKWCRDSTEDPHCHHCPLEEESMLHHIWKWRNRKVFGGESLLNFNPSYAIRSLIQEIDSADEVGDVGLNRNKVGGMRHGGGWQRVAGSKYGGRRGTLGCFTPETLKSPDPRMSFFSLID
ncbi:hypothetical protein D5086_011308 [Populus alba]|uniref:Uncharacterized protein n=1 Tax=Populus alba TaxID=43335 RepID=A0ACC4CDD1_POPAL